MTFFYKSHLGGPCKHLFGGAELYGTAEDNKVHRKRRHSEGDGYSLKRGK